MTNHSRAGWCAGFNYPFLTSYERDGETQLDYAQARYYSSQQGRFTSVDPLQSSASTGDPQTFNRYTYAMNAPANFTDPSGMLALSEVTSAMGQFARNFDPNGSGGWGGAFTSGGVEKSPEIPIQGYIRTWNAIVGALQQAFPLQNASSQIADDLRPRVAALMKNNSQCAPFLNLVLLQLEMSTALPTSDATFVDVFNRAAAEGAFYDSSGRTDDYGDTIVYNGRVSM